ncbi:indolepyruvate ferredoxin oxidoreductase [Pandoraea anhela]|uniref:Indolepyruvate ferredoxin oxidoreductase n=2 Tax=Pandoraea anhela TaxID=2508295 RepID=A0A5E4Z2C7_9BURK|nr:indolepyruvate ferredoxin oxidoreductase [Pandoraea anhela]
MELKQVNLEDKYTLSKGRVFITGTQALVRLPISQQQRDRQAGFDTAGYISGYRGSPLGGFDEQLGKAKKHLDEHQIRFVPGVNEDLAATAVWGTQLAEIGGEGKYDGVFGLWYGKGPGVDRTGDVFRHANLAGTSNKGGVLVLMGDDHTCESSTTCHQSEFAMIDAMIPVLSPASVQEILDYGLIGWALSRYSGCWVGMKCVKDTVEATASIDVDVQKVQIRLPTEYALPPDGLGIRQPDTPHAQEARLHQYKLDAVRAFARVNAIDRVVLASAEPQLGVVTHGKSYLDVLQALDELHLSEEAAAAAGLTIYKVGMVWPLEPQNATAFASGLKKILVVEEKRSLIEFQLKEHLYGSTHAPVIVGKTDEAGRTLFQPEMALDANQIAIAIGERLLALRDDPALRERIEALRSYRVPRGNPDVLSRSYYFCSGCPHNTSTVIPQGSKGYAGIGCHWMSQAMERSTTGYTQMGGEGMAWVGEAPFSKRKHMFQNIGDGTYFHSGLLAIRAAIAAKTNITYKILFNDAVAMTGGQKHDGPLDVPGIAWQVHAEGAKRIVVIGDEPHKYPAGTAWPHGVTLHHRDELDVVQRQLREVEGTSVLIYDQTCAAEKRRRRKRGSIVDPAKRVLINDLVCEGCGDCGTKSNCVSLQPLETDFGRKRMIDQSACNKDYSCVKGFCPSFVTVLGGNLRKPTPVADASAHLSLPEPVLPSLEHVYSILVAGMGGTGVVTIGAILGMAAHLEGRGCGMLDMAGLAQKGGSVWSHVRFGATPEAIKTLRIAAGTADLILGCDLIVAANSKTLAASRNGRTHVIVNTHEQMPGPFARNADLPFPAQTLRNNVVDAVGTERAAFVDAGRLATALLGDSLASNMFMLGFAYQRGFIPVSSASIEAAIDLNGASKQMNRDAFLWGRRMAIYPLAVEKVVTASRGNHDQPLSALPTDNLDELISRRRQFLTSYQDARYADRYLAFVDRIQSFEKQTFPGRQALAKAVARYYFKLLAIKDEYEVARLHTESGFMERVQAQFEGDYRVVFNLAPPLLARRSPTTGEPVKSEFGAWVVPCFRLLAKLRVLRGTWMDIFGYTTERKLERSLIGEYERLVESTLRALETHPDATRYDAAVALASLPERIRGYGHVRVKSMTAVRERQRELMEIVQGTARPLRSAA